MLYHASPDLERDSNTCTVFNNSLLTNLSKKYQQSISKCKNIKEQWVMYHKYIGKLSLDKFDRINICKIM